MNLMTTMMNKMLNDPRVTSNPIAQNAINLARSGDEQGLKTLADNIAKSKGINLDDAVTQIRQMLGQHL